MLITTVTQDTAEAGSGRIPTYLTTTCQGPLSEAWGTCLATTLHRPPHRRSSHGLASYPPYLYILSVSY
ncbi:hypothetical protein FQN60_015853, partial [Etheostoma spectabile]